MHRSDSLAAARHLCQADLGGQGFREVHLGEVLGNGQVVVAGVAHAAVAARPEVLAAHPQHAPANARAHSHAAAVPLSAAAQPEMLSRCTGAKRPCHRVNSVAGCLFLHSTKTVARGHNKLGPSHSSQVAALRSATAQLA